MKRGNEVKMVARERGLSLIELLIALALSAMLILGLVEIFGSTRAAFSASEALARVQENSRFAMEFMRRDVRMAGQLGCLNQFGHLDTPPTQPRFFHHLIPANAPLETATYTTRVDRPLEVYDFTGTNPGGAYAIEANGPVPAAAADWTPNLPPVLAARIVGGGAPAVTGSDVIVVRYFDEEAITIDGPLDHSIGDIVFDPSLALAAPPKPLPAIQLRALYGLTNCKEASLFQVVGPGTGAVPGWVSYSTLGDLNVIRPAVAPDPAYYWAAKELYFRGSLMYRYRVAVYYVGRGASGDPSLFRVGLVENPTAALNGDRFGDPEELIEGVELMQVLLGLVAPYNPFSVPPVPRVDVVAGYQSAPVLLSGAIGEAEISARMARVSSVRTSLLMRSPDLGAGGDPIVPTVVVGDVTITPPLDRHLRHVYDSMIVLRNRVRN